MRNETMKRDEWVITRRWNEKRIRDEGRDEREE